MRHQNGFEVVIKHENAALQEYSNLGTPENGNLDISQSVVHTPQMSQAYITPRQASTAGKMWVWFYLTPDFDYFAGNVALVTLDIQGASSRDSSRAQLIWKRRYESMQHPIHVHWIVDARQESRDPADPWKMVKSQGVADEGSLSISITRGTAEMMAIADRSRDTFNPISGPEGETFTMEALWRTRGTLPAGVTHSTSLPNPTRVADLDSLATDSNQPRLPSNQQARAVSSEEQSAPAANADVDTSAAQSRQVATPNVQQPRTAASTRAVTEAPGDEQDSDEDVEEAEFNLRVAQADVRALEAEKKLRELKRKRAQKATVS